MIIEYCGYLVPVRYWAMEEHQELLCALLSIRAQDLLDRVYDMVREG